MRPPWILPEYAPNPERWAIAAFTEWREQRPDQFPSEAGWATRPEWQTDSEAEAEAALAVARSERETTLLSLDEKILAVETRRAEAARTAELGERRLLTAQGEELVAQVILTLREFGFDVTDVDAAVTKPGDRREDLRITVPGREDWIALGEVRGYSRGAQMNDLLRIGRFVRRFQLETGAPPSSAWYIVNQLLEQDPSARPRPLDSNAAEVQTFGEDDGLIIDTRDLFQLLMSLRRKERTREEIRELLLAARTRLDLP